MITGGGSGIGKAIAKRFTDAGATVVIVGRNKEKLESAAAEISSPRLECMQWDISDLSLCESNFKRAAELIGGLDGFVNAAALGSAVVTGRGYEPWDITEEEWDTLTDVNFKAAFFMMRNEVDFMRARGICGNILNIASNAACMDIIGS